MAIDKAAEPSAVSITQAQRMSPDVAETLTAARARAMPQCGVRLVLARPASSPGSQPTRKMATLLSTMIRVFSDAIDSLNLTDVRQRSITKL